MSKTTKDTKRTRSTKSRKPDKPEPYTGPRVIWLYGAHPNVVNQAFHRFIDYSSDLSMSIRTALGISLDEMVVPIYPMPAKARRELIAEVKESDMNAVFLVAGTEGDFKSSSLTKLYEHCEAAWIHPKETDFHIAMMRSSDTMSYPAAKKAMQSALDFFSEHFKPNRIHTIN